MAAGLFVNVGKLSRRDEQGNIIWTVDMEAPSWHRALYNLEQKYLRACQALPEESNLSLDAKMDLTLLITKLLDLDAKEEIHRFLREHAEYHHLNLAAVQKLPGGKYALSWDTYT